MSRLPILSAKIFEKLLLSIGFIATRQKGSHVFYKHPDGRYTTLPHHPGRDLGRPLIHKILREINLTPDEFSKLLEKR
jgi:predicted RNA binding protein YcfA (HicA-like mRNA interferase family)